MWLIYYFSKLLLDWTILCVDYSLYNQTNHFHSYWNKYIQEIGTIIGWIYQFGVCHITIVDSIIYVGELWEGLIKQLIDNPRWKKCRGSLPYVLVKTHAKGQGVGSTTFHLNDISHLVLLSTSKKQHTQSAMPSRPRILVVVLIYGH